MAGTRADQKAVASITDFNNVLNDAMNNIRKETETKIKGYIQRSIEFESLREARRTFEGLEVTMIDIVNLALSALKMQTQERVQELYEFHFLSPNLQAHEKKVREGVITNEQEQMSVTLDAQQWDSPNLQALLDTRFKAESLDMYQQTTIVIKEAFEKLFPVSHMRYRVRDTHNIATMDTLMPDISIHQGTNTFFPEYLTTFIELKAQSKGLMNNQEDLGQIEDYLFKMRHYQPNRQRFIGLLTNLNESIILILSRNPYSFQRLNCSSFVSAVYHLLSYLKTPAFQLHPPVFPVELGNPTKILGITQSSAVASFLRITNMNSALIAVKMVCNATAEENMSEEIRILKSIQSKREQSLTNTPSFPPDSIPIFLQEFQRPLAYSMQPVGQSLESTFFQRSGNVARQCIRDIAEALHWLHSCEKLAHRDVRKSNIVVSERNGVLHATLIDFNTAASLFRSTSYYGGYICCPPRVLTSVIKFHALYSERIPASMQMALDLPENVSTQNSLVTESIFQKISYQPEPKDDLYALFLLYMTMYNSSLFHGFASQRIEDPDSKEFWKLAEFWDVMRDDKGWMEVIEVIEKDDAIQLGECLASRIVPF